ncbi:hypothetical protein JK635_02525 [Neobacillus sp. YIM B02564]|uniref:HNH endonuclease n=1 Tax=Neobacillus paridis TaxID=2803862 RepID=A0ABS1TLD9_9BACI|nr:hypothetical protein [Neobacillus paridis]MBL4951116.1 hypothetical protein [Neobacillus paridis]
MNNIIRDGLGRIYGSVNNFWYSDDEYWEDHKERNVIFPKHNENKPSPVHIWNLYDNKEK